MPKLYCLLVLLFISCTLRAQVREQLISGQLKSSEDGSPLPGVNIVIKGTNTGTTTDAEGRYSISVPVGSTLVFSFIGMQTREVLVTENGMQAVNGTTDVRMGRREAIWHPSILHDTTAQNQEGVVTLNDHTPSYQVYAPSFVPGDVISIRKNLFRLPFSKNNESYVVTTNSNLYRAKGFRIHLNNAFGVNIPGQLPALQSSYAQGRNDNSVAIWRGPDQRESMSWGPSITTLEYTGTSYPYDRNGMITSAGSGNGRAVKAHDPYHFFRTGTTTTNDISAWFPGIHGATTNVDVTRRITQGIIPGNESKVYSLSANQKRIYVSEKLNSDATLLYSNSAGTLMNRGANLSNIIGSLMSTSPTFDFTNGYGRKNAYGNASAFQLPDGTPRSSAPGLIDNPYGLASLLPDHEHSQRFLSAIGATYQHVNLRANVNGSYEKQVSDITYGVGPGFSSRPEGRYTERREEKEDKAINILLTYNSKNRSKFIYSLGYYLKQEDRRVTRQDGFGFTADNFPSLSADSLQTFEYALARNTHEVMSKVEHDLGQLSFVLTNRNYFSNTTRQPYVNLFPSLMVKAELNDYINLQEVKPYVSVARTIRETPPLFGNSSVLSTSLHAWQYAQYFENHELVWNERLNPETEIKFEAGLRTSTWFNLSLDFNYYNNTTFDLVMPLWEGNEPVLQNAAIIRNKGANGAISYTSWYWYNVAWGISLRWTKYTSMVTRLNLPVDYIPLAGFRTVQTIAAPDEPLGAIYGTTFLTDAAGNRVIDTDGFPIVDPQLKKIGSPIPLYTISLEPFVNIKYRTKLSFIIDFKKGGDVWNGTKAALNYLGRSKESGDLRSLSNYVFDGVDAEGVVNTIPVDFYNPGVPLESNRWVRYGFEGVGEEYIEDTSWIRLNEVALSHRFNPSLNGHRTEITLALIAKNLFLITPYTGVDPGTALFGYSSGTGLDLFNAPALRSYSFLFTIKL